MANTIQLKRGTGSAVPSQGSLAVGELAINIDSGKLYYGSGSSVLSDFRFDKITAETYVISSSVTHMTTSFSSGSTAFGDSAGDAHTFTGDITASGDISSSGNVYAADYFDNGTNISSIYQSALTFGIADTNVFRASASIADNDFLRVNGTVIEGRSSGQVLSDIGGQSGIGDGDLTIAFTDGLQDALNLKATIASPTFTGDITASGNISASGNIISDNAYHKKIYDGTTPTETDTYIELGGASNVIDLYSGARKQINIQFGSVRINDDANNVDFYIEGETDPYLFRTDASTDRVGIGILNPTAKLDVDGNINTNSDITASGNISSSANVYAADYFDSGANINTLYSPIAGGSGIVTVGTIGTGTWSGDVIAEAKLQNQSGTNTGDETTATVNALNITEVGALADGTIASGFGNIDNGTSTLDTGALTSTTITVPTRVFAPPGTDAGNHTGGDVWYFGSTSTSAGGIYYLNASAGWTPANADTVLDGTGMLAVALGGNSTTNGMLLRGFVTLIGDIGGTEDHGMKVYLRALNGNATITAPSTQGHIVRIIGYSIHNINDSIYFNPDNTWVEIA